MVEREAPGGQAGQSSRIENYLGFPAGLSGSELAAARPTRRGAWAPSCSPSRTPSRCASRAPGARRAVAAAARLSANCVLVASGVSYRQLDAPGFASFTGAGDLLRRRDDRGARLRGPARRRHRRRELGRPGGRLLQRVRGPGHHARARRTRWPSRCRTTSSSRSRRCPTSTFAPAGEAVGAEGDDGRLRTLRMAGPDGAESRRGRRRGLRLHRRRAAHRLARGRRGARRARLHPRRRRRQGRRLAAGPRPVPAGDERAGRLRRRRRARALHQARGQRGRGGLDGGLAHPRVPRRRHEHDAAISVADLRAVDLFDDLDDDRAGRVGRGGRARSTSSPASCWPSRASTSSASLPARGRGADRDRQRRPHGARRAPGRADLGGRHRRAHARPARRAHAGRARAGSRSSPPTTSAGWRSRIRRCTTASCGRSRR